MSKDIGKEVAIRLWNIYKKRNPNLNPEDLFAIIYKDISEQNAKYIELIKEEIL